ncbi:uncharacterized protein LAESUDRAFT_233086 [Laetiporus sulphureus 93-53]|uniref:Uncharacterized protein n=1 Tax=Laetiporus sulphureus 93-53 TaxID=1314785 RepID=A0A165DMD3_9APHY|nr:uncharacterized protein LAESUDRAFT_233086 [Laetiporus sulphureus 93-53]KZT05194.1 hypothetical protein LAESUDRAFT_233086 [Laetiporus sulphureus 93-53]
MAVPPEDDIYDDLYGDSADIQDVSPPPSASTEEPPVQIHDTSSEPQQRERKISSGEISLPAKPIQSTELSYSAQIARQFSAYKQTPVQERQQQSRTQGLSTDVEMTIYDGGSTRRPVRPSEMKDEG